MANIELPKDAEGREIPLDTKVLYQLDGSECTVVKWEWEFYPHNTAPEWTVCLEHKGVRELFSPKFMYLTPRECGAPIGEYGVPNYCHSCGVAIRNGH